MNKVISVNLGGIAYQLEENGYEELHRYLEAALQCLQEDPDKEEIVADIEVAIGEKFRVLLGSHKNVVTGREVSAVLREMGPVEAGGGKSGPGSASSSAAAGAGSTASRAEWNSSQASGGSSDAGAHAGAKARKPVRRLYRLNEGAMLFGVCSGLAAFTGVDVLAFRIAFVAFSIATWGLPALVYIGMVLFVPQADTPQERAQAQGPVPTAQDFIKRAREGYYEALKGFPNRQARKAWERKFKDDMRDWGHRFSCEMKSSSAAWRNRCERNTAWGASSLGSRVGVLLFAALFSLALVAVCLFGASSLLTTGSLFGFGLPTGMPIWVGILLLVVFCQALFWPLRFAFGGCPARRCQGSGCGGVIFLLALVLGVCWWLYPDQTRELLREIPPAIMQGANAVRDWWQHP